MRAVAAHDDLRSAPDAVEARASLHLGGKRDALLNWAPAALLDSIALTERDIDTTGIACLPDDRATAANLGGNNQDGPVPSSIPDVGNAAGDIGVPREDPIPVDESVKTAGIEAGRLVTTRAGVDEHAGMGAAEAGHRDVNAASARPYADVDTGFDPGIDESEVDGHLDLPAERPAFAGSNRVEPAIVALDGRAGASFMAADPYRWAGANGATAPADRSNPWAPVSAYVDATQDIDRSVSYDVPRSLDHDLHTASAEANLAVSGRDSPEASDRTWGTGSEPEGPSGAPASTALIHGSAHVKDAASTGSTATGEHFAADPLIAERADGRFTAPVTAREAWARNEGLAEHHPSRGERPVREPQAGASADTESSSTAESIKPFIVPAVGESVPFEGTPDEQAQTDRARHDALDRFNATTVSASTVRRKRRRFVVTAAVVILVGAAFVGQRIYLSEVRVDVSPGEVRDAAAKVGDPGMAAPVGTGAPVASAASGALTGVAPGSADAAGTQTSTTTSNAPAPAAATPDPTPGQGTPAATPPSSSTILPVAVTSQSPPPSPVPAPSPAPADTRAAAVLPTENRPPPAAHPSDTQAVVAAPPAPSARVVPRDGSVAIPGDRARRGEAPPPPARPAACTDAIQALGLCAAATSPPKE